MNTHANDLFHLQTDLIDMKVDMASNKAMDRVVEQITDLKQLISEMNHRLVAVETKLGMVNEIQKEIRIKFIDYAFKAGWLILGVALSSMVIYIRSMS